MASNELQQLRSKQQLVQLCRHRQSDKGRQYELKRTKHETLLSHYFTKSNQQQHQLKRQTECTSRNILTFGNQLLTGPRLRLDSLSIWFHVLLIICLFNHEAFSEGNVGCKFVRTLCLENSEICYDDNIFGKCIPTNGLDVEDIEKIPLTEDESRLLATMLEELQGAGLGWDHPYVQCRIQGSLFSIQKQKHIPPSLCANLAPFPNDFDPAGALALVRFTPANDIISNKIYYPPLKKQGSSSNGINAIFHQLQLQDRQLRNEPLELAHFGEFDRHRESQMNPSNVMDVFLEQERERIQKNQDIREAELANEQKQAAKNSMELYKILAESEPDPQPYERTTDRLLEQIENMPVPAAASIYVPDEPNDSNEYYFPENYAPHKRTSARKGVANAPTEQKSFFRELALEKGVEQQAPLFNNIQVPEPLESDEILTFKRKQPAADDELPNSLDVEESLFRNSLTPLEEEALLAANAYPKKFKHHRPEKVFTEGGVVTMAGEEKLNNVYEKERRKEKARELLANMLGFTRHERLDVKKPGPLIGPPPSAAEDLKRLSNSTANKEHLPAHIKGSNEAMKKKKVVKEHSDEDHAPHTVDTEYAHVFVKNPIDSWSDGVRIMNELANILHMQGYFTYLTVQPHEVSFRVDSNNPDRKTATDIARSINENRGVKNNILRRLGVTVIRAGVGDKIKRDEDGSVSAARIELADQSPDVTHIMVFMFAGAGAAAIIVIFITLILIKRHDKKRDKLGGLQSGIGGAESCSKDYQDLCRSRMSPKHKKK